MSGLISPGLGRNFPRSWEAPSSCRGISLNRKCFVAFFDRRIYPGGRYVDVVYYIGVSIELPRLE